MYGVVTIRLIVAGDDLGRRPEGPEECVLPLEVVAKGESESTTLHIPFAAAFCPLT